jgi:hypothetical protein
MPKHYRKHTELHMALLALEASAKSESLLETIHPRRTRGTARLKGLTPKSPVCNCLTMN